MDNHNFWAFFDPLPLPTAFRQFIVTALLEPLFPLPTAFLFKVCAVPKSERMCPYLSFLTENFIF